VSANLDLVRSIYAAIGRGDFGSAEWADPDIEYVMVDGLSPDTFTGLAGLAEAARTIFRDIEDFRTEAEGCRELDGDRVLVLTRVLGRGKLSGVPVSGRGAEVFEVHDGKVIRIVVYNDRERAFANLGLTSAGEAR
jgi:ketosteroid isomerase-like protein